MVSCATSPRLWTRQQKQHLIIFWSILIEHFLPVSVISLYRLGWDCT